MQVGLRDFNAVEFALQHITNHDVYLSSRPASECRGVAGERLSPDGDGSALACRRSASGVVRVYTFNDTKRT